MTPHIRDYGDAALLVDCDSTDEVLAVADAVRRAELEGVADIVPGARTVLVTLAGPAFLRATRAGIARIDLDLDRTAESPSLSGTEVVIDVVYDGVDLADVARMLDLTIDAVIAAHTGTPWRVAFGGFVPGFAYLVGGDPRLRVPRHPEPRTRVPAGAVALAGEYCGIYPRESPGGWRLIGRTDTVLWDLDRSDPALLTPGRWVRFRSTDATNQ